MDAATQLLADDPARYQGVMFNPLVDQARVQTVARTLRSEQSPVQLSPLPDVMPEPAEASALVVLPRHAGAYNRAAAEAEAQTLRAQMAERAKERDNLQIAHGETTRLLADLERWLAEFGGGKLAGLRERRRGQEQALELLQERHPTNGQQMRDLNQLIVHLEGMEREQRQLQSSAEKVVARLEAFIEQFDSVYEDNRTQLERLQQRLRELETTLPDLADRRCRLGDAEAVLDITVDQFRDLERDLGKEIASITYAGKRPNQIREQLGTLRNRYRSEVERFEGRFKSTAAQGKLEALQQQIQHAVEKLDREFGDLDRDRAEALFFAGDLPSQRRGAEIVAEKTHAALAVAENNLRRAREEWGASVTLSVLDRPAQGAPIPPTAAETLSLLQQLSAEAARLQSEHEQVHDALDAADKALDKAQRRKERVEAWAKRLEDFGIATTAQPGELPADDVETVALVDKARTQLLSTRMEKEEQHKRLAEQHASIVKLTQDGQFPHDMHNPARELFKTMPLEELIVVANDKRQAVEDDTTILRDDLDKMQTHRELIVKELLNESQKAVSLLRRAERLSRMPDDLAGWESEPFLHIHLHNPQSQQEQLTRLRAFVDELKQIKAADTGANDASGLAPAPAENPWLKYGLPALVALITAVSTAGILSLTKAIWPDYKVVITSPAVSNGVAKSYGKTVSIDWYLEPAQSTFRSEKKRCTSQGPIGWSFRSAESSGVEAACAGPSNPRNLFRRGRRAGRGASAVCARRRGTCAPTSSVRPVSERGSRIVVDGFDSADILHDVRVDALGCARR